jgi:hypothetical protein
MTTYQVMTWHGIPSAVKATDDRGVTVRQEMPASFQQEIDRVAMAEGLIDGDAYLEDWTWSEERTREGTADEVAQEVAEELAQEWPQANRPT